MIRIQQLKMPLKHSMTDIDRKVRKLLRLKLSNAYRWRIWKQSIDARCKTDVCYVYTIDVTIEDEEKIISRINDRKIILAKQKDYSFPKPGEEPLRCQPVVVGSGPAGLFCAYLLALHGYQPIVLERGKMVQERTLDVTRFWESGELDLSSNVQFGEGGAGAFSDGKLNTLVKDPAGRNRFVLETLAACGASSDILYVSKPHIGTDMLTDVVSNLREEITRLGGTFYFDTCLTDIQIEKNQLQSITVQSNGKTKQIQTEQLVLAIGHSARDTFEMLCQRQIPMEAKPFAVGFRIEHPQQMMNEHQYKGADMKYLPVASYKLAAKDADGRGVYSFCMCPGGFVVNASSERERLAVNGMSYHSRSGKNANSAIIVAVTPADFPAQEPCPAPLSGVAFQRKLESQAYALGHGKIPQQLYGDFKAGKCSASYGGFASQAKGGCTFADLSTLLPPALNRAFLSGMEQFADYIPGFNRYDAILSGIESRTSSPVRILRGEQFQSSVRGIYPCGEGAGYAGGIMSAAMDGMKVAEAIASCYAPIRL